MNKSTVLITILLGLFGIGLLSISQFSIATGKKHFSIEKPKQINLEFIFYVKSDIAKQDVII